MAIDTTKLTQIIIRRTVSAPDKTSLSFFPCNRTSVLTEMPADRYNLPKVSELLPCRLLRCSYGRFDKSCVLSDRRLADGQR